MTTTRLATASCALGMLSYVGLMGLLNVPDAAADDHEEPRQVLELTGIVRDFRERTAESGHPDFERRPDHGFALSCGNVASYLDDDGKPVYTGEGYTVKRQWRDVLGRPISRNIAERYPVPGDQSGRTGPQDDGAIQSTERFAQWYRDVPGVNTSEQLTLKLQRQADGTYVFDDQLDEQYEALGGFFPIDGRLLSNPAGAPDHNFHFTFELHGEFVYDAGASQIFKFIGDDDVWVYVNGELVIDIGGVHPAEEQYVDLDRLGLQDGETYELAFFFAERHRTQSNFRIVTNLSLESVVPTSVAAVFD